MWMKATAGEQVDLRERIRPGCWGWWNCQSYKDVARGTLVAEQQRCIVLLNDPWRWSLFYRAPDPLTYYRTAKKFQ